MQQKYNVLIVLGIRGMIFWEDEKMNDFLNVKDLTQFFPYKKHIDLYPNMYQFLEDGSYNEVMFYKTYKELLTTIFRFLHKDSFVTLIVDTVPLSNLKRDKIIYKIVKKQKTICLSTKHYDYFFDDEKIRYTRLQFTTSVDNIKWSHLIKCIIHQDFPDRQPQFKLGNSFQAPHIFIVSDYYQAMLYPYDDRGYYVYANEKSVMKLFPVTID